MSKLSDVDSRQNSNLNVERFSIRPVHELLLEEGIPFLTINDKENVKRKWGDNFLFDKLQILTIFAIVTYSKTSKYMTTSRQILTTAWP